MAFDPVTAAFDLGKIAIEKLWPDPTQRAAELRKLEEMRQTGQLAELNAHVQLMLGQIEVNKLDAQSGSLVQAGWRPAIGWVGALSLALAYIPKSIVLTYIWTWQCIALLTAPDVNHASVVIPPFPDLGIMDVIGLLVSMLGIGAMRSYDKGKGTDTKVIR